MRLIDPMPDLTIEQANAKGDKLYARQNWREGNRYKHAVTIKNALKTMIKYDVDYDEFDKLHFTSINGARQIMLDSAAAAAQAMLENAKSPHLTTWQDDHEDYTRAIVQQLTVIQAFLSDDRQSGDDDALDELLKPLHRALNADSETLDEAYDCFEYGFADHGTPLSDIMLANLED